MNISIILLKLFKNSWFVPLKKILSFINVTFVNLCISSKLLVNQDFVLLAVKNIPLFGLKKLLLSLMLNTELFFLLFLKNLDNFSFMTEFFYPNLHMLLMTFLNINLIILKLKIKKFIKLVNILSDISLTLIFCTLLFTLLGATSNEIHISTLLSL